MEQTNKVEGKRSIAKFMDIPECDRCEPSEHCDRYMYGAGIFYSPEEMKYDTSLDWLKPVVEKIVSLGYNVEYVQTPKYTACRIYANEGVANDGPIFTDSVFKGVVLFIAWFNKQSK